MAQGSLKELETQLLLAERVQIAESATTAPLLMDCDKLGRMLRAYIRSLQKRDREASMGYHSLLTTHHAPRTVPSPAPRCHA